MANKESAEAKTVENASDNPPLFFHNPVPVEVKRHAKAGLLTTQNYGFAAEANSIIVNSSEFVEAAKHYPIVFTNYSFPLPAVILGLERENYFVDKAGNWQHDAYIPAYVRKYPFVFMDVSSQKKLLLCVDEGSPHFKKNGGKNTLPFFDGDEPSKLCRNALEFCTSYHNHYLLTRSFCDALVQADLLIPSQSEIKLFNGRDIQLRNFQVIDEKKVMNLPDKDILEFHKKGWLAMIYFVLMSTSHWNKLIEIAASREKKN